MVCQLAIIYSVWAALVEDPRTRRGVLLQNTGVQVEARTHGALGTRTSPNRLLDMSLNLKSYELAHESWVVCGGCGGAVTVVHYMSQGTLP